MNDYENQEDGCGIFLLCLLMLGILAIGAIWDKFF